MGKALRKTSRAKRRSKHGRNIFLIEFGESVRLNKYIFISLYGKVFRNIHLPKIRIIA